MRASVRFACISVAIIACHCGPKAGTIGTSGYEQATYQYHFNYKDAAQHDFMGPDWRLDNYFVDPEFGSMKPKRGPTYEAERAIDENGDGRPERKNEFIYDLRFTSKRDNGVLWIKAHP